MNPVWGILYQGKDVAIGMSKFKGKKGYLSPLYWFWKMWHKKEKYYINMSTITQNIKKILTSHLVCGKYVVYTRIYNKLIMQKAIYANIQLHNLKTCIKFILKK